MNVELGITESEITETEKLQFPLPVCLDCEVSKLVTPGVATGRAEGEPEEGLEGTDARNA